jgi:hypothetical protein
MWRANLLWEGTTNDDPLFSPLYSSNSSWGLFRGSPPADTCFSGSEHDGLAAQFAASAEFQAIQQRLFP